MPPAAKTMDDIVQGPIFSDAPFTTRLPLGDMPPALCLALCCVAPCMWECMKRTQAPFVRGIPFGSIECNDDDEEVVKMLNDLAGNWKIVPLEQGGARTVQFTDVLVRDKQYILTGGMRNTTQHVGDHRKVRTAVANQTQVNNFHFFRAPNGQLYLDYIGSKISKLDAEGGEVELENGISRQQGASAGMKLLWQRGWKADGHPAPSAAPGQQVMGAETQNPVDRLTMLQELKEKGLISDEDYDKKKQEILDSM
eukprot:TRINITY_DN39520_c0_g1_i1.p1 TRINITY_DN39520_c0_g1~~TRINITY_DN39520_c0_g1_i1.p1  ORF type:complete len:253 (+),score=52.14 TRINITY_DN39520_c0_g1_i1:115-873(+)